MVENEIRWAAAQCDVIAARLRDLLDPEPEMQMYSQRDPRWRSVEYAGGVTFGSAGCYVTCVAMIASLAGYTDSPPDVASELRQAHCFQSAYLNRPDRIPDAYPDLKWDGVIDWRRRPADLARLSQELEDGPVIIEVEFRPGGVQPPIDQHFVIAEAFTSGGGDLMIADPWDGSATRLLERYALSSWELSRAIYGARLLRVA